ncbi:hypothetical protein N9166_01355 [bacterium]|nr:hypothetical protein [bacterium]
MATEGPSSDPRRRVAWAIRANKLVLTVLVVAVAYPIAVHYTGFKPVHQLSKLDYPRLVGYKDRLIPPDREMHGIDFSQIYFAAQNWSNDRPVYFPVDLAKWRREWSSTYHPLIHWLYIPISKLSLRDALVAHNLLGISLLLLCSLLALRSAGTLSAFPSIAAVCLAVMFLTPTGLMHLERGQMDLFTAASYVCILALFNGGGGGWAVAAGVFSTLKVHAWLCIGLYWCAAAALWGMRERVLWLLPATILVLTLVFLNQVLDWIPAFLYVAENTSARGPSFTRILPVWLAYALPIASTLAVTGFCFASLHRQRRLADMAFRRRLLSRISFPFAAALALQAMGATPVTHDYRLVALLGLLPALAVWCGRSESVPWWLRNAVSFGYAFFLVIAMRVPPFFKMPYDDVAYTMLALSLCFLAIALYLASPRVADPMEIPGGGRTLPEPDAV